MRYISTRGGEQAVSAAKAICQGLSGDGGLFVPESFPVFAQSEILAMARLRYQTIAEKVLGRFLTDFSADEVDALCDAAYLRFSSPDVAPVRGIGDGLYMLELFHGPTLAFKDVALQMLSRLLPMSAKAAGESREILILVATSGDTGKAALEAFSGVPGVRIAVFYPDGGVSEVQRLQMATQAGDNTRVVAVRGNFDDAQTGVKKIFSSPEIKAALERQGTVLSSANSINLGRLLPQVVYYFSSYANLIETGAVAPGEAVNICVPTGNFGNILAAAYAKNMGLPVHKLICASNSNNVLSDFIKTGIYDRNRAFHLTTSPSMDILISSNLERMLFEISGRDADAVNGWMKALQETGRYRVEGCAYDALSALLYGDWASEAEVKATIAATWREHAYLVDPHTAVALSVAEKYRSATGDMRKVIVAATASPYKFGGAVLKAISGGHVPENEFACLDALSKLTNQQVPEAIAELHNLPLRHSGVCDIPDMAKSIGILVD